jgi:TolA-binding protein
MNWKASREQKNREVAMVKKLYVFIFLSFVVCVPCFAQSTVMPKRETVKSGSGSMTTAPVDSKVTQAGGVNQVESNKDYTKRKILEFEGRIATLEKDASQTATKLTQIQQTLTAIQASLDKLKPEKKLTDIKQPVETIKTQPDSGSIVVRHFDTVKPPAAQTNMTTEGKPAVAN